MHQRLLTQCLGELAEGLGVMLKPERIKFYLKVLGSLDENQIRQAFEYAAQQCKFFPSAAELLELAGVDLPKTTLADEAEAAWLALRGFQGDLKRMPMTNVMLQIVQDMGGRGETPTAFGKWPADQEGFKRREFLRRYHDLRQTMEPVMHNPYDKPQLTNQTGKEYSDWQEYGSLKGLSDHEKGKRVSAELIRKLKAGEHIPSLRNMTFDEWAKSYQKTNRSKPVGDFIAV